MRSDIVDLASQLIECPTVSSDNKELSKGLAVVIDFMQSSGLGVKSLTNNGSRSLLFTKRGLKRAEVILHAHLDVVPAQQDQFKALIKGDKLFGRGSLDMKGGMAVLMMLVKKYGRDKKIGLLVTTDEETGGKNGSGALAKDNKILCDYLITGEPTGLSLSESEKGVFWATLKISGKAAHTSTPWQGSNPVLKLGKLLSKLQEKYPYPEDEKWVTTVSPTQIITNNSQNQIPGEVLVKIDCRYIPEDDPNEIVKYLKTLSDEFCIQLLDPPLYPLPNKYSKQLLKLTGGKTVSMHYATDARFFCAKGIPAVIFGPSGANMHGQNEWVSIKSLEKYYLILDKFIQNI